MNQLKLECGVTLELCAVRSMVLLDFVEDGPESMTQSKFNRMIKYIAGWGVTTNPPPEEQEELAFFGKGEHIQRAAWVRMIATETEIAELMALVMALTKIKVDQPTSEQTELAELRAKVAVLEGENGSD